jgi:hypothetical protein
MKTAALKANPLAVRSEKLPDKPKPLPWKAFNRFARDAQELLEYVEEMRSIRFGTDDGMRISSGVDEDAEWLTELVAKVRAGFARFDHEDNYEPDQDAETGRALKPSHIAKRLSVLAVSFPAGTPGSPEGYLKMLTEHVSAVESLSEVALESTCREVVEAKKFLPAASEVLTILKQHTSTWYHRRRAMDTAERARHDALAALQNREAEKKKQEHERVVQIAINQLKIAMHTTQRLAEQIEARKAELATLIEARKADLTTLVQRHAEAEKRESERLRALRKLTTTEEEAATAEAARLDGLGCGELTLGSVH